MPGFEPVWSARPSWTDAPAPVRGWAEALLGGPAATMTDLVGGFSSGIAARLGGADGRALFVKAVRPALNPRTPHMYRVEGRVASGLTDLAAPTAPGQPGVPRFRGAYDDGDWVALAFDAVAADTARWPWNERDLACTLDALGALHTQLTPSTIASVPTAAQELRADREHWRMLGTDPARRGLATVDPWLAERTDELAVRSESLDLAGETLLHLDLRADNILIDADRRVWFVDWPWACRGPAALDVILLLVNVAVAGHDAQAWLPRSSARDVASEFLAGALALLAGVWATSAMQPDPPGTRGLRAFQRAHLAAASGWLRRLI